MTFKRIYHIIKSIPKGKVLTYKQIADLLGIKDIRLIGFALHRNKFPIVIPCHRVVKSDGFIASGYAYGGRLKQRQLLKKEKVAFINKNQVDLETSLWDIPIEIKNRFMEKATQ